MATTITGVVLHATEWTPLPNVTVYAYSTSGYTEGSDTTDSNGRFLISGLTDRDWMAKLASGQSGHVLLVPTEVGPIDHAQLTGVGETDHHTRKHLSQHHTDGDDALSLDLIAGTVVGPGHGDQTGEALAIHDAGDLTYTPDVLTDWDSDTDPGDVDDALDQLAERVDDLEALGYVVTFHYPDEDLAGGAAEIFLPRPSYRLLDKLPAPAAEGNQRFTVTAGTVGSGANSDVVLESSVNRSAWTVRATIALDAQVEAQTSSFGGWTWNPATEYLRVRCSLMDAGTAPKYVSAMFDYD